MGASLGSFSGVCSGSPVVGPVSGSQVIAKNPVVDNSDFVTTFGVTATPLDDAIGETIGRWRTPA